MKAIRSKKLLAEVRALVILASSADKVNISARRTIANHALTLANKLETWKA